MPKPTDPSDNVCIEVLRPKTVPDQLVALGTVSQVSDIQVRFQITGGIVCLVDRSNVSDAYSESLARYEADFKLGKQPLLEPPGLSELFHKGEQYVVKVIDRETRKGYANAQDIIASVNPRDLQEDNIPANLLTIPYVPLQGAIISIEDHGYRVDLGFKNITGFLDFEESISDDDEGQHRYSVGQIIRCCLKESLPPDSESRIVQLSMTEEAVKKSKFSQEKCCEHALVAKYILPGSTGYLTVMRVHKTGLIVNFLDEFAGFVGLDHLENDWLDPTSKYKIADSHKCTVLYYNSSTKTFALSLQPQKTYEKILKHFLKDYYVGQIIKDAKVAFINGLKSVNFKVDKYKGLANVRDALEEEVTTMNKDELHLALDATFPDGSRHKCRIKSINYADLLLILNLRSEFLELSCVSVEELEPADFIEVQVKKYVSIGIVVSFGLNLRAIILNSHLRDYISSKSYKRYPIGMPIKCRVLKIDPDKHPSRIYLTNKEELMDPEMTIIDAYDKSFRGETVNAIIVKLKTNGLIVELFNNVKGFIPKRFCSNSYITSVSDLFEVGQIVTCTVYRVEPDRQTLALSMIPYEKVVEMIKTKRKNKQEETQAKALHKIDRKIEQNELNRKQSVKRKRSDNLKEIALDDVARNGNVKKVKGLAKTSKRTDEDADVENVDEFTEDDMDEEDNHEHDLAGDKQQVKQQKSRLERSKEARKREEEIREIEKKMLEPSRPAQSVADFERLVIKSPNTADVWIKYSKFFLDNVETEKARIVCRRALNTINFREEKEKLKIWLHMILIEARYGGVDKLREIVDEASQTNDKIELYRRATKVLTSCSELDEAEHMYNQLLDKLGGRRIPEIWLDYLVFLTEQKKDLQKARATYETAVSTLTQFKQQSDIIHFKSRFAHLEFKHGEVERGKTLFENLLSEHPKRMDLWSVYGAAIRKYGTRQLDTDEVQQQNEQILERIASLQK